MTLNDPGNWSHTAIRQKPTILSRGGEPIYYHGPHELCISAGGPQNQSIILP